jgi:site-specific recombinase XerD
MDIISTLQGFHDYLVNIKSYTTETARSYKRRIEVMSEIMSIHHTDDLTPTVYEEYIKIELDRGISKNTTANIANSVRAYIRYLSKHNLSEQDFNTFESPKRRYEEASYLEPEIIEALIDNLSFYRDKLFYRIMFESGARISELLNLTVEDINGDKFTVMGKGHKPRICFISMDTAWLLKAYIDMFNIKQGYVFLSINGKPISGNSMRVALRQAAKRAGIEKAYPHLFRHAFATTMLENGADVRTVQTLLGHKQLQTTQVYLHVTDKHKQEQYKRYAPTFPQDYEK